MRNRRRTSPRQSPMRSPVVLFVIVLMVVVVSSQPNDTTSISNASSLIVCDPASHYAFCLHGGTCGAFSTDACLCPDIWSGNHCETPVNVSNSTDIQLCNANATQYCLHGGTCLSENSTTFGSPCSCPDAFVGLHCQFPASVFDYDDDTNTTQVVNAVGDTAMPDDSESTTSNGTSTVTPPSNVDDNNNIPVIFCEANQQIACYNHATCKHNWFDSPFEPCVCGPGYTGPHCELPMSLMSTAEFCDAQQQVFCVHGSCKANWALLSPCDCDPGFAGPWCETMDTIVPSTVAVCDDAQAVCYNEGTCNPNWLSSLDQPCNCPRGYTGAYCQFPTELFEGQSFVNAANATTTTQPDNGLTYCDDAKTVVCFHQGQCKSDWQATPETPCDCLEGFVGDWCEFTSPVVHLEPCTRNCRNGGVCVKGTALNNNNRRSTSGLMNGIWSHHDEQGEFCRCLDNYAGPHCEHQAERCGDGNTVCLHGSKCRPQDSGKYKCGCDDPWTPEASLYDFDNFCQHHHTDVCTPSNGIPEYWDGMAMPYVCVNDGVCKDVVGPYGRVRPSCECPPLYMGPHCEFLVSADELDAILIDRARPKPATENEKMRIFTVFVTLFGVLFAVWLVRRARQLRRRKKQDIVINIQGFRDDPYESENVGALSANGNMLFPAFSAPYRDDDNPRLHDVNFT